jgi:hypothetical protein
MEILFLPLSGCKLAEIQLGSSSCWRKKNLILVDGERSYASLKKT